jgi:hypothetical protein
VRDEDEITRPGTPDALRTMREILARLDVICDSLDRIEKECREAKRDSLAARSEAARALTTAQGAASAARFADKRVDTLVARVQAAEGRAR